MSMGIDAGGGSYLRPASEPGGLWPVGPAAGAGLGLRPTSFVTTLVSAATTRSANLSYSSDRADQSSGLPEGTGAQNRAGRHL